MQQIIRGACLAALFAAGFASSANAQKALTWNEVRARFETNNPTLLADKVSIDESKAQQITAYLRPNPQLTLAADGTQIASDKGVWKPFAGTYETPTISSLHERQRKRELRLESAQKGTLIVESNHADLERTLLFSLRGAFVATLQAKAVLRLAKENLAYYDNVLDISRTRFSVGDIAQIDLDRLELQRVQYESDVQSAEVNLRTAKIHLLALLNDRTPVEQFDVTGPFDFRNEVMPLEEFRRIALGTTPDLNASIQSIETAETDHPLPMANRSPPPTSSGWVT